MCAIFWGIFVLFFIHSCRENRGTELRVTHISDGVSAQSVPLNKLKLGTSWISLSILEILILLYPCSHEAGQIKGFKLSWNVYLFETGGFLGAFNWGFLTAVRAKYKFTAKKRKKKNGAIKDPDVTIPISWLPPLHREACGLHNKKNIFTTWSLRLFFFSYRRNWLPNERVPLLIWLLRSVGTLCSFARTQGSFPDEPCTLLRFWQCRKELRKKKKSRRVLHISL